jgi:hypothetical protein
VREKSQKEGNEMMDEKEKRENQGKREIENEYPLSST